MRSCARRAEQVRQHLPSLSQMTFGECGCVRRFLWSHIDGSGNVYLNEVDKMLEKAINTTQCAARFADDLLILISS
jgi:hypothetical protein